MSFPVTIETDRLVLREIVEADWRAIHAYESLRATAKFSSYDPWTEDFTRAYVARAIFRQSEHPRRVYSLLACLKGSGSPVGNFSLAASKPGIASMGTTVAPDQWGKGFATESVQALLGFGFDELGLRIIHAETRRFNATARRVLENSGMSAARFSIEFLAKNAIGLLDRTMGYAMFRQDWIAERSRNRGTASVIPA